MDDKGRGSMAGTRAENQWAGATGLYDSQIERAGGTKGTHNSVTSSKTISKRETERGSKDHSRRITTKREYGLTKSSNPSRVPVNSRSFFMTTQIFEPMHLSISSASCQIVLWGPSWEWGQLLCVMYLTEGLGKSWWLNETSLACGG